jgi:PKD repeat protein
MMMKKLLFTALLAGFSMWTIAQNVWLNELHYDNAGGDVGEFIEVALENAGSYTLSDFEVYLYNGNNGANYNVKALDVYTAGTTTNGITLYYYDYPTNGIQNGAPDGLAIVYQGAVVSGQFLSYEGSFMATDGPANGMTSDDIGVAEIGSPIGESLQLSGTGSQYSDFSWEDPAAETKGTINNNQTFGTPATVARIVGSMQGWNTTDPDYVMSQNVNGLYELTKSLDAGTHDYKVIEGDSWSDPNYPGTDQHVVLTQTENVTWKVNITADLVTHLNPVLAGDFFSSIGGNDWDPAELMGEMTDPDGDDIFTVDILVPVGDWECKVTLNHNWDQSTGGNIAFSSDGANTTTFTYDFPNNVTTISGPPPPTATITFEVIDTTAGNYNGFNLKGSWDGNGNYDAGWNGGAEHSAFYDDGTNGDVTADDNIWTCQQDLVVDNGANTWEWGVNDTEHNWVAGNWQFTIPDDSPQTQSWTVPDVDDLVINEIMYNSPGADEEWIELYNNTDAEIDLENWKIVDSDANHTPIIITAGHSIAAEGYFTISVATNGSFPFTPDFDGTGNFGLNNGGDAVRIWNPDGILVDIVEYDDNDPWPTEPDGDGPSLSLIDPDSNNFLAESWDPSPADGGTPGETNFPPEAYITVIDPNGGEFVELESEYLITWTYGNWDGNVRIEIQKDGQTPELIESNVPVADESYLWFVTDIVGTGDDYKIIITNIDTDIPSDSSDNFFSIVEAYDLSKLVFTEIMYNPPESGDDSLEFVEIYNNSLDTVALEGFYFSEGIEFIFPDVQILPDTFLLVAKDSLAMQNTFGTVSYQWTSGGLSNGGEDIELKDAYNNIIDYVDYDDSPPWDTLPDGTGPSLTLCNPNSDNSLPESWTHSVNFAAVNAAGDTIWATPGFECQIQLFAAFEADTTLVVPGDSVMFTDLTTGDPTSWSWTFEEGNPATFDGETPPYIVYDSAGRWNVTLVVSDGINNDSVTYEEYIWVGAAPVADFYADPTDFTAGSSTNFFSLSTGDSLTFAWTFEGGTPETSDEENPADIHYYIMADSLYDVTLIVSNDFGSDTLIKEEYIRTTPEGIGENILNEKSVIIFPNPAQETFTINLPDGIDAQMLMTDISGKVLKKETISSGEPINLNGMKNGIYLLRIIDIQSKSMIVKKLIIH